MIGERLKQERERLGYTQENFAAAAGAKRRTLVDWERSVSSPTAVQLGELSKIGVNVNYIVTGEREPRPESYYSNREVEDAMHEWLSDAKSLGAIEIDSRQTYEFLLSLFMRNVAKVTGAKSSTITADIRDNKTG
ncbi:helix-turn-helix domain-containing protein [Rheinheimera baltica]|uniref:helix-turn-helix domain-containing protein n=1 Tax=Rheinheimera baltica TaxID=67576 RepID=UPI000683E423|nr:helix-turn-helix transcriptional regulator [Rheinheimera baltica]